MSTEENKALIRRFYEEVFNKRNLAALDDFYAPDHIDHTLPSGAGRASSGIAILHLVAVPAIFAGTAFMEVVISASAIARESPPLAGSSPPVSQ